MAKKYEIKDSGQRQDFTTGAVRDTQEGKPRFDLIPPTALYRVAMHYGNGSKKYNPWNWAQGMEFSRFFSSMFRHMMQFALGDKDEDHLAAVVFNAMCIMHFQDLENKPELDDMRDRIPHMENVDELIEIVREMFHKEKPEQPETKPQEQVMNLGGF